MPLRRVMNEYLKVLNSIRQQVTTIKSNFSREYASLIAEASSRGHLTCLSANGRNCGVWQISSKGMKFLKQNGGCH